MITKLRLQRFKNFRDATLDLGPFTLLIGANASGKSNLRDAFRFLHGIGRGYTLVEILDRKVGGGQVEWNGIRGGIRGVVMHGEDSCEIRAEFEVSGSKASGAYDLTFECDWPHTAGTAIGTRVLSEALRIDDDFSYVSAPDVAENERDFSIAHVSLGTKKAPRKFDVRCVSGQPALWQLYRHPDVDLHGTSRLFEALSEFDGLRFLEPSPRELREPSHAAQHVLGDHGENLSSVLNAIWKDEGLRGAVIDWIRCLTPLDVGDIEFAEDPYGHVFFTLVEANGQKTSAYSASDGTLRFLAMIAALYGPRPPRFIFLEEIDTGIHPARLHLLFDLIEQRVLHGDPPLQIVATTHAPQVLDLLSERMREFASVVYRCEGENEAHIRRVMDFPNVREILKEQGLARLHGTGWFEDIAEFELAAKEVEP